MLGAGFGQSLKNQEWFCLSSHFHVKSFFKSFYLHFPYTSAHSFSSDGSRFSLNVFSCFLHLLTCLYLLLLCDTRLAAKHNAISVQPLCSYHSGRRLFEFRLETNSINGRNRLRIIFISCRIHLWCTSQKK
jgi:hypothetical protein